jgi:ribosome biogenesis protein SSF1/2
LQELGPRIKFQLVKIEDGVCDGAVLYHSIVKKSEEEIEVLKARKEEEKKLKEARKREQEKRVKAKSATVRDPTYFSEENYFRLDVLLFLY